MLLLLAAPLAGAGENPGLEERLPSATSRNAALAIPLPAPGEADWEALRFRSIENETVYEVLRDDRGQPSFRATSDCGASAMLIRLPEDLDLDRTPRLAWRWRVETGVDIPNERERAGDDFAARVYVLFEFDPGRAGIWGRMEHSLGRRLFDAETPGQALNYVWASREAVGESWTSPHREEAQLLAIATNSPTSDGAWREAVVDVRADARRLFDPPPRRRPYALGLMTDADDTCQTAVAEFSDFRFLGPAP